MIYNIVLASAEQQSHFDFFRFFFLVGYYEILSRVSVLHSRELIGNL